MKRIMSLMDEKNHYLEKFYALNERELVNFMKDDFGNLEGFYETRERILEVIKYLDAQMEMAQNAQIQAGQQPSVQQKRQILEALTIKDEYVSRIIEQDLQVLACIESAKNSIIRELQDIRKAKKAVGGYKAPQFNHRLDEEA